MYYIGDAERANDLKFLQPIMDIRRRDSLIIHGSGVLGKDPPSPFHDWGVK